MSIALRPPGGHGSGAMTRQHFALNYSGNSAHLPPPLCFTVPAANRAPAQGGIIRPTNMQALVLSKPNLMMDPSDPSTWQRPYVF